MISKAKTANHEQEYGNFFPLLHPLTGKLLSIPGNVKFRHILPCLAFLLLTANVMSVHAEIVTDGSMGPHTSLSSTLMVVPENLGKIKGSNLFHSFSKFNVSNGQTAGFTGSNSIKNVISRVTGGSASRIDGNLISVIGQADFYFINPAGVVFGPNAVVDVPGSFHVSTADSLIFSDGVSFNTKDTSSSSLSTGNPEAFGFTGDSAGRIQLDRTNLVLLTQGGTMSMVGGDIFMESAYVQADTRDIRIVANGSSAGLIPVDGGKPDHRPNGSVKLNNTDILGLDSENISVSAGDISFENSSIVSETALDNKTKTLELSSDSLSLKNGSQIRSSNNSDLRSADISIDTVSEIWIEDNSFVSSEAYLEGNGGKISVDAGGKLHIRDGGLIFSNTAMSGNAGSITVKAEDIAIHGKGSSTGIVSETRVDSEGHAGSVDVHADNEITILNGGVISSNTFGSGNARPVEVTAKKLTIDGEKGSRTTGISSEAGKGSSGNGGSVTVNVEETIELLSGGLISSSTFGGGDAGQVEINAGDLEITGFGSATGVSTQANRGSHGDAGTIEIELDGTLKILSEGSVSSSSQSVGNAGSIKITAQEIFIDGADANAITGIESRVEPGGRGTVGNIDIKTERGVGSTGNITINNGGKISIAHLGSANSGGSGSNGQISIEAGAVTLSSGSSITSESTGSTPGADIIISTSGPLDVKESSKITSESENADAGHISVNASPYLRLKSGQITTSVAGTAGNGGDIKISTPILIMDSGFIQANTQGIGGRGGAITIDTDYLIGSYGRVEIGGGAPKQFNPEAGLNIIQAAAPEGAPGDIDVSVPVTDITGSLLRLNSDFIKLSAIQDNPCRVEPGDIPSSLTWTGIRGSAHSTSDSLYIPLTDRCEAPQ